MTSPARKRIALPLSVGLPRFERLIEGVQAYVRDHGLEWSFISIPENSMGSILDMPGWPADGAIVHIDTRLECMLAGKYHMPIVNISGTFESLPIPRVHVDQVAVGKLAAAHLMQCGFQHFAFYGLENAFYSEQRLKGFRETLAAESFQCAVLQVPTTHNAHDLNWKQLYDTLGDWLRELPKPVGLLVVSDTRARIAVEVCNDHGIVVPAQIGVVGVDNDYTICEHAGPTITSIDKNDTAIGREVARMLHRMMNGEAPESMEAVVPPKGVVTRQTTEILPAEDANLARAIDFIRSHYHEPITVDWIAESMGISRRWLEFLFKRHTGSTPYQFLLHFRIARARHLLESGDQLSVMDIAQRTGFDHARHFAGVFKRVTGQTPTEFRKHSNVG